MFPHHHDPGDHLLVPVRVSLGWRFTLMCPAVSSAAWRLKKCAQPHLITSLTLLSCALGSRRHGMVPIAQPILALRPPRSGSGERTNVDVAVCRQQHSTGAAIHNVIGRFLHAASCEKHHCLHDSMILRNKNPFTSVPGSTVGPNMILYTHFLRDIVLYEWLSRRGGCVACRRVFRVKSCIIEQTTLEPLHSNR